MHTANHPDRIGDSESGLEHEVWHEAVNTLEARERVGSFIRCDEVLEDR
jgi:hypothetical protein